MKIDRLLIASCAAALAAALGATAAISQPPPPPPAAEAAPAAAPRAAPPAPLHIWSPKKTPYAPYVAPNKPLWKLADVVALHKGQKSWTQPIVRNNDLSADWHQIAPGQPTQQLAYSDNRTGIIVWDGEIKVNIEGQEPFVARKGFEIDVPFRVPFTLEATGDKPALYFEIHATSDMPIYPVATNPTKPKPANGYVYEERLASGGLGTWDAMNKPYLDFYKDVVGGTTRATSFISAQQMFVNNIRGRGVETPPASNLGHYHIGYDEFWFVMEGNIDVQIEGFPIVKAAAGDIILAKQGHWHRASFGGPVGQMDTRVAINPFPAGLHNYTMESAGRQ